MGCNISINTGNSDAKTKTPKREIRTILGDMKRIGGELTITDCPDQVTDQRWGVTWGEDLLSTFTRKGDYLVQPINALYDFIREARKNEEALDQNLRQIMLNAGAAWKAANPVKPWSWDGEAKEKQAPKGGSGSSTKGSDTDSKEQPEEGDATEESAILTAIGERCSNVTCEYYSESGPPNIQFENGPIADHRLITLRTFHVSTVANLWNQPREVTYYQFMYFPVSEFSNLPMRLRMQDGEALTPSDVIISRKWEGWCKLHFESRDKAAASARPDYKKYTSATTKLTLKRLDAITLD